MALSRMKNETEALYAVPPINGSLSPRTVFILDKC